MKPALHTVCALFSVAFLVACGGISTSKMVPDEPAEALHPLNGEVAVGTVAGGRKPTFGGPEMVDNDQFSDVLFNTLKTSGIFTSVEREPRPTTDMIVNAKITRQTQEVFGGLGYHGILNVEYEFVDAPSRQPLWVLEIPASHRVTFGQAFTGAARTIKAREGSVRNNLSAFTRALNPWKAAAGGSAVMLERFRASGSDLNSADENGNTPVMLAAFHGHSAAVDYLLQQKVAIDDQNEQKSTALLAALGGRNVAIAEKLLQYGSDWRLANIHGETALMLAAAIPSKTLVAQFVELGLDPNSKSENGLNAVLYAALRNGHGVMKVLFNSGGQPTYAAGDIDVAVAVGTAYEAFADWFSGDSASAYTEAVKGYRQAIAQLDEAQSEVEQQIQDDVNQQKMAAISADVAQAISEIGWQYQARVNARQFLEAAALTNAVNSGAGYQGYFSELRELERNASLATMLYPDIAFSRSRFDMLVSDAGLREEKARIRTLRSEIEKRMARCEELSR